VPFTISASALIQPGLSVIRNRTKVAPLWSPPADGVWKKGASDTTASVVGKGVVVVVVDICVEIEG